MYHPTLKHPSLEDLSHLKVDVFFSSNLNVDDSECVTWCPKVDVLYKPFFDGYVSSKK